MKQYALYTAQPEEDNKSEVKDSFLTNYTRPQVVRFYSNCNLVILDGGASVTTKIVDRLFEASQKVWLRDFLLTFFANAAKGIKTRLNFYVNTTNINTADEIERLSTIDWMNLIASLTI